MAASRLQLISKKLIKPSSPTPPSLRSYKLSHMDQLNHTSYMPIASFYPSQPCNSAPGTTQISQLLENSLSKLLKSYYPFAGTLTDNVSINCNDRGVTFSEARINCPMSEMLIEPDESVQNILFPRLPWSHADHEDLVLAQLNHFDCGGKALTVCVSHKLGDGYTLTRFVNDWAAIARQPSEEPSPQFIGTAIYPTKDTPVKPVIGAPIHEGVAIKRFSFGAKTINRLKELVAAESGVQNPTRVEVLTAFIYKCAVTASMVNSQSFKPSVLIQFANMRRLIVPPLPQTSIGNFFSLFTTPIADEGEMKLSRLVSKLRRGKLEFYDKCKRMNPNELLSLGLKTYEELNENALQGMDLYQSSSICGFPNDLDFGWGKPSRVVLACPQAKSGFLLMDDHNGDEVQAIVVLDEKAMPTFESDKEILAFASPNQSF